MISERCPRCGVRQTFGFDAGLCPGCLLAAVLDDPEHIGDHDILGKLGQWIGVLMATIGTDSSLGAMRLDGEDAGPMAVLVAPQDRSRSDPDVAGKYFIVLHDRLPHGAGVSIESPRLQQLRVNRTERDQLRWSDPVPITDDTHRDPMPGFEGRWLAGFAPVGKTGFIVIVQSRYDEVVEPNARLSRRLVSRVGAAVLLWSVVFCAALWGHARHLRRLQPVVRRP